MQAYLLSVAGAVLLSAVVSILVPEGRLGPVTLDDISDCDGLVF